METQIQEEKIQEKQEVNMSEARLYDIRSVARKLSVSRQTIYKLIQFGQLPVHRMGVKNCIRISEDDVSNFLKRRKQNAE